MACGREYARASYWRNPQAAIERSIAWTKNNPEKAREKDRRRDRSAWGKVYRAANQERIKEQLAEWQKQNPDKRRANEAKRRATARGSDGSYTDQDIIALLAAQNGKCSYCQRSIRKKFQVDHIIPLKLGGLNRRPNLQLLCASCNSSKGAKHPVDFARTRGLLV